MPDTQPVKEPALDREVQGFSFALEERDGRLQLRALHRPDYGAISADWSGSEMRRRIAAGKKQLLARAIGLQKIHGLTVLDATAGLGRDGYTLAALGAQVTMCERHPQILALLRDAQRLALLDETSAIVARRIRIQEGDALAIINAALSGNWDVIYLDPMYPHRGKSALPQKEMQLFRDLTAGDPDADALLAPALACARKRVVVKRPLKAPWLAGREPSLSLKGTQARFDVYLISQQET
ncbi:MAG: class I SAM-dependent methyltransferase [Stenotrophobium sp.]